jgi:hypothetical protein
MTAQKGQNGRMPRSDRDMPRMTERDLAALHVIGEQYAVSLDHLQVWLARLSQRSEGRVPESTARHCIARWVKLGLVRYRKILAKEPGWLWLTPRGLRELGYPYSYREPSVSGLHHLYWCNQIRFYITARLGSGLVSWEPERKLRYEALAKGATEARVGKLPDAIITTEQGSIALEVELTAKSRGRLLHTLRSAAAKYPTVWYFCSPEVQRLLERELPQMEQQVVKRIMIYPLEKAVVQE